MAGPVPDDAQLFPLADGSIALANRDGPAPRLWRAVFHDGDANAAPVPEWLARRQGARAFVIRGGRANVPVPVGFPERSPSPVPCQPLLEILTPSGESCGVVRLAADACTTLFVAVEGTVFAQAERSSGECVWRWWRALLR